MIELRVHDEAFVRLLRKWLKAGVLEENGSVLHPETGTPQGGVISPMLAKFGLKLAEAKSGIVKFNRHDPQESEAFTFLGFEFYWAKTRCDFTTVKRRTSKKKFRSSLKNCKEWLKKNRSRPLKWLREKLAMTLRGYWNYYGVVGNSPSLTRYWIEVRKLTQKWLNRRSQRKSYGAEGFLMMWDNLGIAQTADRGSSVSAPPPHMIDTRNPTP